MSLSSVELRRAGIWRPHGLVRRTLYALWRRYLQHRKRQRDLAELAAMDDPSLRDLGISRGELRAAIRAGIDLRSERC